MHGNNKNLDGQYPLISVNLVVYNGGKYIRQCLDSVKKQTYGNLEVNILNNNSSDSTKEIIKKEFPEFNLVEGKENLGTWPGQEELLKYSHGKCVVALSVDVVLDPHFVEEAVKIFEKDPKIGAVQGKIYKFELPQLETGNWKLETKTIDTCGFEAFKSRKIINIGHGEKDKGQFDQEKEIFAVEGAVPVLRRQALEDCRLESHVPVPKLNRALSTKGQSSQEDKRDLLPEDKATSVAGRIIDPDFFWYGDDLDLAWRMRLFGWKQVFAPAAIAYHDRQTTKALAGGGWREFIKIRKTVPMFKRRLDWRNMTLAIIKNDFASNLLRDSYYILWRQLRLWGYFLLFETSMILEIFRVAKMLPKMLKRRSEIMRRARVPAQETRKWFFD